MPPRHCSNECISNKKYTNYIINKLSCATLTYVGRPWLVTCQRVRAFFAHARLLLGVCRINNPPERGYDWNGQRRPAVVNKNAIVLLQSGLVITRTSLYRGPRYNGFFDPDPFLPHRPKLSKNPSQNMDFARFNLCFSA